MQSWRGARVGGATVAGGGEGRAAEGGARVRAREGVGGGTGGRSWVGCGGQGGVKVREVVSVRVPGGGRSGARWRREGKGTAGLVGEPGGELY